MGIGVHTSGGDTSGAAAGDPSGEREDPREQAAAGSPLRRPAPRGDIDIVEAAPAFKTAVRGYDRFEVDNYVAWAETEVLVARRLADDAATRWAACAAELVRTRKELAEAARPKEPPAPGETVADLLRQAAEEAADLTASAEDEAEDLLERARAAADAVLARARQEAERTAASAAAERERLAAEAAAERERLAAEAAAERQADAEEAARRLAREQEQAQAELADLCARLMAARAETEEVERRQDEAVARLRDVLDQVGTALRRLDADIEPAPVPPPVLRPVPAAS